MGIELAERKGLSGRREFGTSHPPERRMLRTMRDAVERWVGSKMPPLLYCRMEEILRTALNPARRGGRKRRTGQDDVGIYLEWDDGERFYFNHHLLHNRYIWPDGLGWVHRLILAKYQDGPVRLEPRDILIEAGSNVGEFTTAAAPLVAHLYGFEPDPMTFGCLQKNTAHLKNVTLHHAGLGDFEGEAQLFLSRENSDSSFVTPESYIGVVNVPVMTIAAVAGLYQLERIDFLKLEAEGFEPEILAGCGRRLRDIRKVAVDCGPERHGASTYPECEALLRDAGFKTWRRERDWMLFAINQSFG